MREIEQRPGNQVEGGEAGRGRELADDDVVGGKVERGDNETVGDGFGDRLSDAKPRQDRGQGARLRLLRRLGTRVWPGGRRCGRSGSLVAAPDQLRQIARRKHRGTAEQNARHQRDLEQRCACNHS